MVVNHPHHRLPVTIPTAAMYQVENDSCLIGCWKRVAMQAHPCGSCQLCIYTVATQMSSVVAWLHPFFAPVLIRPKTALGIIVPSSGIRHLSYNGHHGDVVQVATARSAQMCMGKANHGRVATIVA